MPVAYDSGIFSSVEARPAPAHQAALAELEHTLRAAISTTRAGDAGPITVASSRPELIWAIPTANAPSTTPSNRKS